MMRILKSYLKGLWHFYVLRRHRNLTFREIVFLHNSVKGIDNIFTRLILTICEFNITKLEKNQ